MLLKMHMVCHPCSGTAQDPAQSALQLCPEAAPQPELASTAMLACLHQTPSPCVQHRQSVDADNARVLIDWPCIPA